MSKLLNWPSVYYFYPIGNTIAISLSSDTPLEESVTALLLGCGDPRHILFTIHTEPPIAQRTLDFTCCDFEPAVLARNVLLFSMIMDDLDMDTVFNIFFHFRIDSKCRSVLIAQCNKLLDASDSIRAWHGSSYGASLRMCTSHTLSEIRRHWELYVGMYDLEEGIRTSLQAAFNALAKTVKKHSWAMSRSAGPLVMEAFEVSADVASGYWSSGTTFSDSARIAQAKELNATFVYSLGSDAGSLHYGTHPLVPFHLAAVFGNTTSQVTTATIVQAAREQFCSWCRACRARFNASLSTTIRFILGDAMAVSQTLLAFGRTGTLTAGLPIAPWKTTILQLLPEEYMPDLTPSTFNVIHTSNLEDHIGLLNVIVSATPLLSPSPFSVLYTESLLHLGTNATKEFAESLHGDLTMMSILTGVVPVDYLCAFSSRCNTHELIIHKIQTKLASKTQSLKRGQFHQVTTWKRPGSGDTSLISVGMNAMPLPTFDPEQLGTFLYDVYLSLYDKESARKLYAAHSTNPKDLLQAALSSNIAHYNRESFVLFCKLVRDRLCLPRSSWTAALDRFIDLQEAAWSLTSMDTLHFQDLWAQFNRHGLYRTAAYELPWPKIGPFAAWATFPDLVRIVLIVPRDDLSPLRNAPADQVGTPLLHCAITGINEHNNFTSIHTGFGWALMSGTAARPSVVFEEDKRGWEGHSPLVVSFVAPAWLLVGKEPPTNLNVSLCVRGTPAAVMKLTSILGEALRISTARLMDRGRVIVVPEPRLSPTYPLPNVPARGVVSEIGTATHAAATLDEQYELLSTLTVRVSLTDSHAIREFSHEGSKCCPVVAQLSPCVLRMTLAGRVQDVYFPFPVQGENPRLRLDRQSRYIEIVVPPSRSFLPGGFKVNPYPVLSSHGAIQPWSLHRVNLSQLPILNLASPKKVAPWYNIHVGSMLSNRERSLRRKQKHDALMFVKDSIHSIFVRAAGTQGPKAKKVFALTDEATRKPDTLIFVHHVRFDGSFQCLVVDAHVLPLTETVLALVEPALARIHTSIAKVTVFDGELQSWKQLLPALVERCRTSWTHTPNCEYRAQGKIPLSEEVGVSPLCGCGEGKEVGMMVKNALWKPFAPHVTPIALSPLFAVSYLETVGRGIGAHRCGGCRGEGKPKLRECSRCRKIRYCSPECQRRHWKTHKPKCHGE